MPSIADAKPGKKPGSGPAARTRIGGGPSGPSPAGSSSGSGYPGAPSASGYPGAPRPISPAPAPAPAPAPVRPVGGDFTRSLGSPGMRKARRLLMDQQKVQELSRTIGTMNFFHQSRLSAAADRLRACTSPQSAPGSHYTAPGHQIRHLRERGQL